MPPLPMQIRVDEHLVAAIDRARTIPNPATGHPATLSRHPVILSVLEAWAAAHAEAPPGPPGARVVVPPPDDDAVRALAAEVAAAPHETLTTGHAVVSGLKVTPQQQRVLEVIPLATTDPEGFSRKDIMQVTGLAETAVDSALFKLHQRGHLRRVAKGQYVRP
jgi:hypothetical protein